MYNWFFVQITVIYIVISPYKKTMGITVTKQRYKIKPLLCVTDKNPNNITWNVLVFLHGFHVISAGETTRVSADVAEWYV